MRFSRCTVCHDIVGWIGLLVNLALSILKIFIGLLAGSHALLVDAVYSAKDIVASILIIIGLKFANEPIDNEHRFGHGKIEFIISLVISLVLFVVTCILLYFAALTLVEGKHEAPHLIALWTAIYCFIVNVFMRAYTYCVAEQINSPMIMVLSRHHKADSIASMAVALGIIGSHYLGMPWLDSAVAILEGVHLLYLAWEVFHEAFQGLMDSSAPNDVVNNIKQKTLSVKGVKKIDDIRTNRVGQDYWVTLMIAVEPELTVEEATEISASVEKKIAHQIDHIGDVNVSFKCDQESIPEMKQIYVELKEIGNDAKKLGTETS